MKKAFYIAGLFFVVLIAVLCLFLFTVNRMAPAGDGNEYDTNNKGLSYSCSVPNYFLVC